MKFKKSLSVIIALALCISFGFVCFGAKSVKSTKSKRSTKSAKSTKPVKTEEEKFSDAINQMANKSYLQAINTLTPLIANSKNPESKSKYLYLRATCYRQAKSLSKAISDYKKSIEQPGFPFADLAKLNIATEYASLKDRKSAINWYETVVQDHPDSLAAVDAQYQLGELCFNAKQYEQAAAYYTKFATSYPNGNRGRTAIYKAGQAYQELKRWSEAYIQYYKIIYHNDEDLIATTAIDKLRILISAHPEIAITSKARMTIASALLNTKKYPIAREQLKKVVNAKDDLSMEASYYIADSYFREGKYTTAVAEYNAFAKRYPDSNYTIKAQYQVASCQLKLGKIADFKSQMTKFATNHPQSDLADDAEFSIAKYYFDKGRYKEATEAYNKAVDKYPTSELAPEAFWNVGWCNFKLKHSDLSQLALKRLATDYPKNPKAGIAGFWAGVAAEKLGKWQDAYDSYKMSMESGEKYYSVRSRRRAEALIKNEKVNEDIASLQAEQYNRVKIDESVPAWQNIGHPSSAQTKELIELKLFDDVINESLAAIESSAYMEYAHYNLSISYEKMGEYSKAWAYAWRLSELPGMKGENGAMPRELYQMLYPAAHGNIIAKSAEENELDPLLVSAIIFEESRYNQSARSRVGACGLMQIMPSTGLDIAKALNISDFNNTMLLSCDTNIKMGTWYFKKLIDRLHEHIQSIPSAKRSSELKQDYLEIAKMLAIGAYNGGGGRVQRWIDRYGLDDVDEFIENIALDETRNYIKKVYDSYEVYKSLYRKQT